MNMTMQYKQNSNPESVRGHVLIIDDNMINLRLMAQVLRMDGCEVETVQEGKKALNSLQTQEKNAKMMLPDVILLDISMPEMDGYEVCKNLKAASHTASIPVIFISALDNVLDKVKAFEVGAADYVTKPIQAKELVMRVRNQMNLITLQKQLYQKNRMLEYQNHKLLDEIKKREQVEADIRHLNSVLESKVRERTQALETAQLEILERLAMAGEFRDDHTGKHTQRVGHMAALIYEALGKSPEEVKTMRLAARLHDIGKIAIPDSILLKSGKLTNEEYATMQKHTILGAEMLSGSTSPLMQMAEEIALNHHERFDGKGYPQGLSGNNIPLSGQVVAVADVYDALSNKRSYKRAWSQKDSIKEIIAQKGRHFCPEVVDAFIVVMKKALAS